jgi:antirestriction protein ArdC
MDAETEGTPDFSGIRHDGARNVLAKAVAELATSEGFQRWLDARRLFHDYSLNNTLMIVSQRPSASQVAGYRAWQALGRQVRKGEKGITILAPMVVKKNDDEGEGRRVIGFRAVHVFDIAQTDNEPLAECPTADLQGDDFASLYVRLEGVARSEGLTVETEQLIPDLHGYYQRSKNRIVLNDAMSRDQSAKTLAHELAHHFDPAKPAGAEYVAHRGEAECVAESAAYIVAGVSGLDTSSYSVGYVAGWTGGDAGAVYRLADRIDHATNAILAGLAKVATRREEVAA